jgi:hypothetical protein
MPWRRPLPFRQCRSLLHPVRDRILRIAAAPRRLRLRTPALLAFLCRAPVLPRTHSLIRPEPSSTKPAWPLLDPRAHRRQRRRNRRAPPPAQPTGLLLASRPGLLFESGSARRASSREGLGTRPGVPSSIGRPNEILTGGASSRPSTRTRTGAWRTPAKTLTAVPCASPASAASRQRADPPAALEPRPFARKAPIVTQKNASLRAFCDNRRAKSPDRHAKEREPPRFFRQPPREKPGPSRKEREPPRFFRQPPRKKPGPSRTRTRASALFPTTAAQKARTVT